MKKLLKLNFVRFMQGLTLLLVSIIVTAFVSALAIIYTPIYYIVTLKWQTGLNTLGDWFYKLALSIDQFGNVLCAEVLQFVMAKKGAKNKFGGEDDTVSYILGRLKYEFKLTIFGKFIVLVLHVIDKDHVEKAIESKIESDQDAILRIQENDYYGD